MPHFIPFYSPVLDIRNISIQHFDCQSIISQPMSFLKFTQLITKRLQSSVQILYRIQCKICIHCIHRIFADIVSTTVRIDHFCTENLYCDFRLHRLSSGLVLHFPSADLEPHHFGKPARRGFRFGMVEFLRTAFDLPTVQSNSLATRVASGQIRSGPLVCPGAWL